MTDEELIKRLRLLNEVDANVAADRIEQLAVTNEALQKALKDQSSVSDRLSEKLYKAEGLLEQALRDNSAMHGGAGAYNKSIRDFIAEMKGENHE